MRTARTGCSLELFEDVVLKKACARKDSRSENPARPRRSALDILRGNPDKGSTRGTIKRAARNEALLLQVMIKVQGDRLKSR